MHVQVGRQGAIAVDVGETYGSGTLVTVILAVDGGIACQQKQEEWVKSSHTAISFDVVWKIWLFNVPAVKPWLNPIFTTLTYHRVALVRFDFISFHGVEYLETP